MILYVTFALLDSSISPELQEVLYRALERDPRSRYAKAHEFAWDLEHLDKVGIEDREELQGWNKRKARLLRRILYYAALALVPVAILLLMVLITHRR